LVEEEGKKKREVIPVEVKFRRHIEKKDTRNLVNFMEKKKLKLGYVVTRNMFKKEEVDGRILYFVPGEVFLIIEGMII